jgi:hypothetical protein
MASAATPVSACATQSVSPRRSRLTPDATLRQNEGNDLFGHALAIVAGDLDGQQMNSEIVVGAMGEAPGGDPALRSGIRAYRLFRGQSLGRIQSGRLNAARV